MTLGVSGHLTPVISKYIEFNYQILFKNQQDNNKDISRDMGSAAEGQDSRAPACQDSMS